VCGVVESRGISLPGWCFSAPFLYAVFSAESVASGATCEGQYELYPNLGVIAYPQDVVKLGLLDHGRGRLWIALMAGLAGSSLLEEELRVLE
jgi:hypothetical protein